MDLTRFFFPECRAAVVAGPKPSPAVRFAARELATALATMTGRRIPVRAEPLRRAGALSLFVGDDAAGPRAASAGRLAEGEIEIAALPPSSVVFRGGSPAATAHAVFEWLDLLGCRWFAPGEARIPVVNRISVPDRLRYAPSFEYRDMLWLPATDGDWACRNRLNGSFTGCEERHGGRWTWADPFTHSFHWMVPADRYAKTHPEYFSLRTGQGRLTEGAQLCLSNPDVFAICRDFVLERMAGGARIVSVSQNDCANPCQCDRCAEKDRRAGSHAGSLLEFLNRIAEETAARYPDRYVSTLAYTYTQTPPKGMEAHPNVVVKLCHMEPSCDAHPLEECPKNRVYVDCLRGWTRVCSRVYVWHYVTNFLHNLGFHPNLDAVARDVRFYRDAGVKGFFFQGQRQRGVSFAELQAYTQARLAWNADRDLWTEADEFLAGYYGPAAPQVRAILTALHGRVRRGRHADLYTHPAEGTFAPAALARSTVLLEEAFEAAGQDGTLWERLEFVRLWLSYTRLAAAPPPRAARRGFVVPAAPGAARLLGDCRRLRARLGVEKIQEFPASHQDLGEKVGWAARSRTARIVRLENGAVRLAVVPEFAGMILSCDAGRELFQPPESWILGYPFKGGYTEGITADGCGPGFVEAYRAVSAGRDRTLLRARLGNGVEVRRTIVLAGGEAAFTVSSEYRNPGRKALPAEFHSFAILSLGEPRDILFFRFREDGSREDLPVTPPDRTTSAVQWLVLKGDRLPRGAWGIFNRRLGAGLLDDCRDLPLVECGSNAYLRDGRILLETRSRPMTLPPGGVLRCRRSYRAIAALPARLPAEPAGAERP